MRCPSRGRLCEVCAVEAQRNSDAALVEAAGMIFAVEDREVCTYYEAETPGQAIGFHLELCPDATLEMLRVRRLGEEPSVSDLPLVRVPGRCSLDHLVAVLGIVRDLTARIGEEP